MKTTNPYNCNTKRYAKPFSLALLLSLISLPVWAQNNAQGITFSKDIMPILQDNCQECHRPQGQGPMSFMTYEEVRPWAPLIQYKVVNRQMPPWHIDRTIGIQQFKNDRSLSDEEVRIISDWVNAGAPEGNNADLPPAREFADSGEWSIGEPDVVVTWEYNVPAVGADLFGDIYSTCLLYTSPSPRDRSLSRMPSSA